MRAMILAAGLGTRLRPLTDATPKPLVPLAGRPMVDFTLDWLEKNGIHEVLMNIHHHPEQMRTFAERAVSARPSLKIEIQDETKLLLGSGGAIREAAPWLFAHDSAALILNADGLMNPVLASLVEAHQQLHRQHGVLCTLAVMAHPEAGRRYNAFAVEDGLIKEHVKADPNRTGAFFHFPGLYIIEKEALAHVGQEAPNFCIVEKVWKPLLRQGKLGAWLYEGIYRDLGTVADLEAAEKLLTKAL